MKKLFLAIITLLFIIVISVFYLLAGLNQSVLNQNYYDSLINDTKIVENLYDIAREELPRNLTEEKDDEDISSEMEIVIEDMITILLDVYNEDWLKETLLEKIDQALQILEGNENNLTITITLDEKKALFKSALTDYFEEKTNEELTDLEIERADIEEFVDEIVSEMSFLDEAIEFDLTENEEVEFVIENYAHYRTMIITGFLISFLVLTLLAFALIRKRVFKYLGILFTVFSLIFIGKIIAMKNVVIPSFADEITNEFLNEKMLLSIINVTLERFLYIPIIMLILGIILIIIGYKTTSKKDPYEPDFEQPDSKITEKLNENYEKEIEKSNEELTKKTREQEEEEPEETE